MVVATAAEDTIVVPGTAELGATIPDVAEVVGAADAVLSLEEVTGTAVIVAEAVDDELTANVAGAELPAPMTVKSMQAS